MQSRHLESWGTEQSGGEQRVDLGSTREYPAHTEPHPPQRFGFTQTRQSWGGGDPATLVALRVLPIKLLGITRETLKGRSAQEPMKVLLLCAPGSEGPHP